MSLCTCISLYVNVLFLSLSLLARTVLCFHRRCRLLQVAHILVRVLQSITETLSQCRVQPRRLNVNEYSYWQRGSYPQSQAGNVGVLYFQRTVLHMRLQDIVTTAGDRVRGELDRNPQAPALGRCRCYGNGPARDDLKDGFYGEDQQVCACSSLFGCARDLRRI